MKQLLVVAIALIASISSYSQQTPAVQQKETKFEQFNSKFGTIVRTVSYPIPDIKRRFGKGETEVVKLTNGNNESRYFLKITNEGQYSTADAVIEYTDILEILKALAVLKQSETSDLSSPYYLESKFGTSDGFEVGYYILSGKSNWYLRLEKIGRDATIFPTGTSSDIEQIFVNAKTKIEELKK